MAPPPGGGFSPGMPPPRPSSSSGHNGHNNRGFETAKIESRFVKSSPLSEPAESPLEQRLGTSKFFSNYNFSIRLLMDTTPHVEVQLMIYRAQHPFCGRSRYKKCA